MITAAAEILGDGGVEAITIEAVVRRSGVAKTTLYRHFGGVEGLVFATVVAGVGTMDDPDTGTLLGDLRQIQRNYLEAAESPASRKLFVWMIERAMGDPDAAELFRRTTTQPGPTIRALQRAIARGELAPTTNVEMAMHLIQGPLISKRIVNNENLSDEEFDALLEMTVRGLTG